MAEDVQRTQLKKKRLPGGDAAFSGRRLLRLPEGLDDVRGGRGSGVRIRLPGKGDGGAGDIGHLRFGRGARDEVWISGPVGLNRDSKLFMLKTTPE